MDFNYACQLGIADIELICRGERKSEAKASNIRDFFDAAFLGDAVDLSYFATRPKNAFAVESKILGMIKTVCVGLKLVNRESAPRRSILTRLGHRQLRQ